MRLRYRILLFVSVLLGIFLWGWVHGRQSVIPTKLSGLPASDKERITVDPATHKLTIQTAQGIQTLFLPDRVTTIDVTKAGGVSITDKPWGLEHAPFVGGTYGLHAGRVALGCDVAYFHKLDLGVEQTTY